MKTILCLLTIIMLVTGCITPPQATLPPPTRIFNASEDKVWPQLVSQIGLAYPIKAIEKDSGLITTDAVMLPAGWGNSQQTKWIENPNGFLTTWDGLRVSLSAMAIETGPGKTQVTISTHYEAFENNISKSWVVCQSNGSLENDILNQITIALQNLKNP